MVEKIDRSGRIPPVEPVIRPGESREETEEQRRARLEAEVKAERRRREDEARKRGGVDTTI